MKYCTRIADNILHISQIPNFGGDHSDKPIYKTLEKSWILTSLRKEYIFVNSKGHSLPFCLTYRGVLLLIRLGIAIFRVTLRDRTQVFVKKTIIYEDDVTKFVFIFFTSVKCEEWQECAEAVTGGVV